MKNRKINLLIGIIILGICASCSKDAEDEAAYIDGNVDIWYHDDGISLFDPANGSFTIEDVTVEYLLDDKWIDVKLTRLGTRPFIYYNEELNKHMVRIFVNIYDDQQLTRVKISDLETDLIEVEVRNEKSSTFITKLFYNTELKWASGLDIQGLNILYTRGLFIEKNAL